MGCDPCSQGHTVLHDHGTFICFKRSADVTVKRLPEAAGRLGPVEHRAFDRRGKGLKKCSSRKVIEPHFDETLLSPRLLRWLTVSS
jgi:hypothetical protein